jgi:hypothetical protein
MCGGSGCYVGPPGAWLTSQSHHTTRQAGVVTASSLAVSRCVGIGIVMSTFLLLLYFDGFRDYTITVLLG